jgi:hypothetical protein
MPSTEMMANSLEQTWRSICHLLNFRWELVNGQDANLQAARQSGLDFLGEQLAVPASPEIGLMETHVVLPEGAEAGVI